MASHETLNKKIAGELALPILDVYELGDEIIDRRAELPEETQSQLMPWEAVVYINRPEVTKPAHLLSTMKALMELTDAPRLSDVGEHGPSIASVSTEANKDIEALTKYQVAHSRDSLQVAMDLRYQYPKLLASTILLLAETQGVTEDHYVEGQPFRQEEPGRIMLLNRDSNDEIGQRFSEKLGWGWPFYGTVDATPSYISAVAAYVEGHDPSFLYQTYEARDGQSHTIGESFFSAVHWVLKKMESNTEGLLEFRNKAPKGGMINQAWKDSAGAYVHADGSWANHYGGIASVEVQARAYDALMDAAKVYRDNFQNSHLANDLSNRAAGLREHILNDFWAEDADGGYFVLGTDRDEQRALRQMKVRSSNMGHLLNSQVLLPDDPETARKREATIKSLFSPELLTPHGVRTLAKNEAAFRKGGYHTGSVWLWDSDYIAQGMERHGYFGLARHLRHCTLNTVNQTNSFIEFVQGDDAVQPTLNETEIYVYDKKYKLLHLFEQLPQEIQAWTVSAIMAAKYKWQLPNAATDPAKLELEARLLAQGR